jgi:hypothetical protein
MVQNEHIMPLAFTWISLFAICPLSVQDILQTRTAPW